MDMHNDRAMITLYQMKTNANARFTDTAAFDALLASTRYGSPRCGHFGFSIQVAFLEVRKCDLRLLFLLDHTNILFLSTWVSELHRN